MTDNDNRFLSIVGLVEPERLHLAPSGGGTRRTTSVTGDI